MSNYNVPEEIVSILDKIEKKQKPTATEQSKMRTFLGTLTTGIVNPANTAKELNNPEPMEVDVSLQRPETLEDRVRRIMSVSARIAEKQNLETPEEADDFNVVDEFDVMPNSPFEAVDHFAPMQPETPPEPEPEPTPEPEPEPPTPTGGEGE